MLLEVITLKFTQYIKSILARSLAPSVSPIIIFSINSSLSVDNKSRQLGPWSSLNRVNESMCLHKKCPVYLLQNGMLKLTVNVFQLSSGKLVAKSVLAISYLPLVR